MSYPSIGKHVLYHASDGDTLAAIITRAVTEDTVDLCVFHPTGGPDVKIGVPYLPNYRGDDDLIDWCDLVPENGGPPPEPLPSPEIEDLEEVDEDTTSPLDDVEAANRELDEAAEDERSSE